VLERHHCFLAHQHLNDPSVNLLGGLRPEQRSELRQLVTPTILDTDMTRHFKLVDDLAKRSVLDEPFSATDAAARKALMGLVLHAADIGAQV